MLKTHDRAHQLNISSISLCRKVHSALHSLLAACNSIKNWNKVTSYFCYRFSVDITWVVSGCPFIRGDLPHFHIDGFVGRHGGIGLYFFQNEDGNSVAVNGVRLRYVFVAARGPSRLEEDGCKCRTNRETLDFLCCQPFWIRSLTSAQRRFDKSTPNNRHCTETLWRANCNSFLNEVVFHEELEGVLPSKKATNNWKYLMVWL